MQFTIISSFLYLVKPFFRFFFIKMNFFQKKSNFWRFWSDFGRNWEQSKKMRIEKALKSAKLTNSQKIYFFCKKLLQF